MAQTGPASVGPMDFAPPAALLTSAIGFAIADDHSGYFRFTQENARLSFANGHLDPRFCGDDKRRVRAAPTDCHSSVSGNPVDRTRRCKPAGALRGETTATVRSAEGMSYGRYPFAWIPACAGMTRRALGPPLVLSFWAGAHGPLSPPDCHSRGSGNPVDGPRRCKPAGALRGKPPRRCDLLKG
jgi:hypothetical protein